MEFDFLPEFDDRLQSLLAANIPKWHTEVKVLLPELPNIINVSFDNQYLAEDKGAGGFARSPDHIVLAFDVGFKGDRKAQFDYLRGSYFHEAFHIAQGFVGDTRSQSLPAMHYAINEGAATKFEIAHAGITPEWGTYLDEPTMQKWVEEVKTLPPGYDWRKWQISEKTGHKWVLFRVGMYIIDRALKLHPDTSIVQLVHKTPEQILALANIPATHPPAA